MLRRFSIDFALFSMVLDAALVALALGITVHYRPAMSPLPYVKFIPEPLQISLFLYFAFPVLWIMILYFFSVYDGQKTLRIWKELASLTLASLLAIIALAGLLYLSYRDLSRFLFVSFVILAYLFLVCWRIAFRLAYRAKILTSVQRRNILIIGAGEVGVEIERQIHLYQHLGLRLVGFLYDPSDDTPLIDGWLGSIKDARQIVGDKRVDDVVIALPNTQNANVMSIISELQTLPVHLWLIPDYYNLTLFHTHIEELAGITLVDLRAPALSYPQRLVKRSFDILLCILFFPFGLVIMGITALAIWIVSGRPIIFRQTRVGENGRLFTINKFRTMISSMGDADYLMNATTSPEAKTKDDRRITRLGRFLRRTSLDELPQIFNIFKGEMSLVGPRPEIPSLVEQYQPWQYQRFSVPPGMTGWWQISGRSDRPMHLHTQDDLYYIENYSVFLDIMILARTISAVIIGKGAY